MDDDHKAVLRPRKPGEQLKVAETVLRRRDRNLKAAADRAKKVLAQKAKSAKRTHAKIDVKSAPKLLQNRRRAHQEKNRLKTLSKKMALSAKQVEKGISRVGMIKKCVTKGRKVLLCIRNAREGGTQEVKVTLKRLRLTGRNRGVFVLNNEEMMKDLKVVEPFVFWGPPTLETVTDLLYKKAHTTLDENKEPVPLQDNRVVEEELGQHGLLCVEDLVDCVYHAKDSFTHVSKLLLPMQFADARQEGLHKEIRHIFGAVNRKIDGHLAKLLG